MEPYDEKPRMHRTTIMLPSDLHRQAVWRARDLGISLGEFVRQAVRARLERKMPERVEDPLFADHIPFDGDAPTDLAEHHDRHLYGDEP